MKAALVIVDMQEVLIPVVWRGAELADRIAGLADRARERGVPVVALQQIGGPMFDPEAPGTRLSHRLRLQSTDIVVRKTATDGFYRSGLEEVLNGVGTSPVRNLSPSFVPRDVRTAPRDQLVVETCLLMLSWWYLHTSSGSGRRAAGRKIR